MQRRASSAGWLPVVRNFQIGRHPAVELAAALRLRHPEYDRLLREAQRAGRSSPWGDR
jgi:hypothetical protein